MPLGTVRIQQDRIRFERYPFRPASVHPDGEVAASAIAEVDLAGMPPMVLTREGEFLMVPADQREALQAFAERHQLPVVQREDVWMLLLEPFLDTEFSKEAQARTLARLAAIGLSADEVARIRREVERLMLTYTALTWEWAYYGLFDVLEAMGRFGGSRRFAQFYAEAMRLARLGPHLASR